MARKNENYNYNNNNNNYNNFDNQRGKKKVLTKLVGTSGDRQGSED